MTKDEAINKMREKGADDAAALRTKANTMTGTEIIAAEIAVPDFDATKDYSACPAGTPVADEGQVWTIIQPHNAANYQGRPLPCGIRQECQRTAKVLCILWNL